jgi:hypothetical protein
MLLDAQLGEARREVSNRGSTAILRSGSNGLKSSRNHPEDWLHQRTIVAASPPVRVHEHECIASEELLDRRSRGK